MPVTEQTAKMSAELLKAAGLHGHKYAIDATVAEAALRQPSPVALLTSDIDDMTKLCGNQVRIVHLWPTSPPRACMAAFVAVSTQVEELRRHALRLVQPEPPSRFRVLRTFDGRATDLDARAKDILREEIGEADADHRCTAMRPGSVPFQLPSVQY